MDVAKNDKELIVTAEVSGVSENDVDVTLMGDLLTIKGEKKAEEEQKNGDFSLSGGTARSHGRCDCPSR